jgi:hypothetical protein
MEYKRCCICGLTLPISIMQPIQTIYKGKKILVGICDRCKTIKETEATKERP